MPSIRYLDDLTSRVISQHQGALPIRVQAYTAGGATVIHEWYGFISNAGSSYLKNGKIVRLLVDAISSGDGTSEEEWIVLPEGHFALGCWIPDKSRTSRSGELYGLIDELGWPMTTLRYDEHINITVNPERLLD
jgi:hypothetical protein